MSLTSLERSRGCLIGAAYGDMLGAGVEFLTLAEIRRRFGPQGITVPVPAFGFSHPVVTDDTQMAMATARGIVRTSREQREDDAALLYNIWTEYRAWYASQQDPRERRGPGSTCLGALATGRMGSIAQPLNHSAGCGGIMRAHPVGIAFRNDHLRALELGMASAAITHGHPNGFLPAGLFALMIADVIDGMWSFTASLDALGFPLMKARDRSIPIAETSAALEAAVVASTRRGATGDIIDDCIGQTPGKGGGWLGHDALAIAVFAAFRTNDPLAAVHIAVNHSGDSDSTGSIAGALMGAEHGPQPFLDELAQQGIALEHQDELEKLAKELHACAE